MRVLVIAAHPDDEVLGVGGAICKHVEDGDDVYVCIVTKAYEPKWSLEYMENKEKEQREVDIVLGIKKRYNLDLPTIKLNTLPYGDLNEKITAVVDDVNPCIVYTHFESDLNYDHTLIFRASMVAARPPKRIKLMCYETLSETEWGNRSFQPNIWIDIKKYLRKKIQAFEIYSSEVKPYPHPRSQQGIELLGKKRGTETCLECAEAFVLIRDVML